MDRESPELIEQQMEQTRESLTEKVSLLEEKVFGQLQSATDTVQGTMDSVQETVQSVKSAVQDTVQSVTDSVATSVQSMTEGVKGAMEVRRHVAEHPWAMVGGAAAAGFVTGMLVFRRPPAASGLPAYTPMPTAHYVAPVAQAASTRPGWLNDLFELAGREVKKIAEQAIARASSSLRETVDDRIPELIERAIPGEGHAGNGAGTHPGVRRGVGI